MAKILDSFSEDEYGVIRTSKRRNLAVMDEDELLALHRRVRRARNKYVGVYRRKGAAKVSGKGSRAEGKKINSRRAAQAAVFEEALSRVSRQLAVVAHESAEQLKAERLALARGEAVSFAPEADGRGGVESTGLPHRDRTRERSGRKKYEASTIAAGARRQSKKDAR